MMGISLGTDDIVAASLGDTDLVEIQLGDEVIWPVGSPPVDPNVLFSDDFNRADGAVGAGDYPNNNFNVVSNEAVSNTGFNPCYNNVALPANCYLEFDVIAAASDAYTSLILRSDVNSGGWSQDFYAQLAPNGFWGIATYNGVVDDVRTLDYSAYTPETFPISGRARFEIIGNIALLSLDGVYKRIGLVSGIDVGGYSGMFLATGNKIDNYEAGAAHFDHDVDFVSMASQAGLPNFLTRAGTWEIINGSGAARKAAAGDFAFYDQDLGTSDMIVQGEVAPRPPTVQDYMVLCARGNGNVTSSTGYQGFWNPSTQRYEVGRTINNSYGLIGWSGATGSVPAPLAAGTQLTLRVTGTGAQAEQTLWADGVMVINTQNQEISSGQFAGFNGGADQKYMQAWRVKALN